MDLKSLLIALCLVSAWVTYGLGFYVYAKNPRSPVNRLFLAVMLGSTYWGIGEFLIWYVNGYSGSWFWLKASSFWTIIIILTVHFVLAFTQHPLAKRENLTYLLIFLYLPALIISIIEICTDSIFIIEYLPGTGYYYTPVVENPVCQMVTSYFLLVMLGTVYLSVKTWQQSSKEKNSKTMHFGEYRISFRDQSRYSIGVYPAKIFWNPCPQPCFYWDLILFSYYCICYSKIRSLHPWS